MNPKPDSISNDLRKKLEVYLSKWKFIALSLFVAMAIGYTYLRYATYQYKANATIKIIEEQQSQKLPSIEEIKTEGLFSDGSNKIKDEIQVIRSRTLIENVVKKLKLNIRYFAEGKIIEQEQYSNPPIKISFFESDSIIHKVDTTLYLRVKSPTEFLMFKEEGTSFIDRDESQGQSYAFGDRIKTGFGGIVIIPNIGIHAPMVGANLKISIKPVSKIINGYQKKIMLSTEAGSTVIKLELSESIAQKAIDILNELIDEYNKDVLTDKEAIVKVTSEFINSRLQAVSKDLEDVDFTAEQLQKNNKLTALNSQADIYLESEKLNEDKILNTSNTIQLLDYLQKEINSETKNTDLLPLNIGIEDSNLTQITKSHNELVAQRDRILLNSSKKNPVVINLNNQINGLKLNLETSVLNMKRTSELRLNSLNKEDVRIRNQLYSAPTKERQFRDIKRQQDIKESLYLYLLQKREESTIRLGMYSSNAKIIDSANSSFRPVAPNMMMTYLAFIILGLVLPIGYIYILDLLDTKVYTKEDVMNLLNIPFLGDVPKTNKKEALIKKIDYSPKAESFRIMRSNIDFLLKNVTSKSKKIFITSTRAQEGKSHTSTNLASSISFSEKSVLLIEMDIRVPKIKQYLNLEDTKKRGLSDYIADTTLKPNDIITKHKDNEFLDIILSGTIPPNPSELLMNERVEKLFNYFEDKYDYIIADTAAVGLVSDTLLISKFADMFVYVVSADNVDKRELVGVAQKLYTDKRLPNMTILLNATKPGKKGYGYAYGYGNNPRKLNKKWYQFR